MSLERAKRVRRGFEGGILVKMAGIVFGVPQYASLFSRVPNIPSPTGLVAIFSVD